MAVLKTSTINDNPIWHSGNDGTGSGLDADTLDGLHASSFLRSDSLAVFNGQIQAPVISSDSFRSSGATRIIGGGFKDNNLNAFTMFSIDNLTGSNNTLIIEVGHHHSGGGQHGSWIRTVLALNNSTSFTTCESRSSNFGGGLGFTITRPVNDRIYVQYNGSSSFQFSFSAFFKIECNKPDIYLTNIGLDGFYL